MAGRRYTGRTVAITGAAGGLGRALTAEFLAEGARVALIDRDADGLRAATSGLPPHSMRKATFVADITDPLTCLDTAAGIREALGPVDVLIHAAGITHVAPFSETEAGPLEQVMAVNFHGACHMTRALLDDLRHRHGQIVVISSVAGFAPLVGRSAYAASKHALHGLFETLRAELHGDGVAVTLACPTFIATPIRDGADGTPGASGDTTGRALSPEVAARRILAAARKERRVARIGTTSRIAWWLRKTAPTLYDRMMRKRIRGRPDPPLEP